MTQSPLGLPRSLPFGQVEKANAENSPDYDGGTFVCEICEETLHWFTPPGEEKIWIHARAWMQHNHDAIPVKSNVTAHPPKLCDFCGITANLQWAFDGDVIRQKDEQGIMQGYGHIWRACETCAPMVKDNDLLGLADRFLQASPIARRLARIPGEATRLRARALRLHGTFLPTIHATRYIGPPIPAARLTAQMMPKIQAGLDRFWNHPDLHEKLTSKLKRYAIPGVHAGQDDTFVTRYDTTPPKPVFDKHVHHLAAGLGVAELYWLSADYTSLATVAGKDFTELSLRSEDLPSRFGLMVFDRPIQEIHRPHGPAGIRAVSWTPVPGGLWINTYIQAEENDPLIEDVTAWRTEWGYLLGLNTGTGFPWGELPGITEIRDNNFMLTIIAAWHLLSQPGVAEVSTVTHDKKLVRSYARTGKRLPTVNIVNLRRQPRRKTTGTHVGRPLEYRQRRKGHWKMVPYGPQKSLRRPHYISQYIAGPDGAPFQPPKPTVRVLK